MQHPDLLYDTLVPAEGVSLTMSSSSVSWFDKDGIYCSASRKDARIETIEELKESTEAWISKMKGEKICWLMTVNPKMQTNKEIRDYLGEVLPKTVKAMALISTSVLTRMMANLFFSIKDLGYPTKVFSDVEHAKVWLKHYL